MDDHGTAQYRVGAIQPGIVDDVVVAGHCVGISRQDSEIAGDSVDIVGGALGATLEVEMSACAFPVVARTVSVNVDVVSVIAFWQSRDLGFYLQTAGHLREPDGPGNLVTSRCRHHGDRAGDRRRIGISGVHGVAWCMFPRLRLVRRGELHPRIRWFFHGLPSW